MKIEMTPEEHARLHRRRGRQALGLVIAVLVLIGVLTSWKVWCCSTPCLLRASRTSTT